MLLLLACTDADPAKASGADSLPADSADPGSTADSADPGSTADSADSGSSTAPLPGVLIPLYLYPLDGAWDPLLEAAAARPDAELLAVVNINSSPYVGGPDAPGDEIEPAYAAALPELAAVGIQLLGYVPTGYGSRDRDAVIAMCEAWSALYPEVGGVFLDEMASGAGDVEWYTRVVGATDAAPILANPGTTPDGGFVGLFEGMVVYESPGLPDLGSLPSGVPRDESALLAYALDEPDPTWLEEARGRARWIYLTDDDLPNPWDSISPWLDALLAPG